MTFSLLVVVLIFLFAWLESRNSVWKSLSSSYSTEWKYTDWRKAKTLSFWRDTGIKNWFNHVNIEILDTGLAIYLPFFKTYISSILIPWEDLELREKISVDRFGPVKLGLMPSQELYVSSKGIYLAIPYSYKNAIECEMTKRTQ